MLQSIRRAADRFRGSGEAAVTIPPMDGAFRPNFAIENSRQLLSVPDPDSLALAGGTVLVSSGQDVVDLEGKLLESFSSAVTCLAGSASGALAIGLDEGAVLVRGGQFDGTRLETLGDRRIVAATAAAFDGEDGLLVCLGSQRHRCGDWKRDLMQLGASGSVWRVDMRSKDATCLGDGLAWPYGVSPFAGSGALVSESWRHRLLHLSGGQPRIVSADLPGYPARLVRDPRDAGYWLSIFAPRLQLIEFVLREKEYREAMLATIDPEHWIAPSLHAPGSFLEPLQGGGLKQLGELKPWAPSRSYGLAVRLDSAGRAMASYHSRANGTRHGVTSCVHDGSRLIVLSRGAACVVEVDE